MRNKLLAKWHCLVKEKGLKEHKVTLYGHYGVGSAKDLSDAQLQHLIATIEGNGKTKPYAGGVKESPKIKKLRSAVLSLLTKSPRSTNPKNRGLGVPNGWEVLNPFIEHHAGGALYQLTEQQLETFRKKLLAIRESGWSYGAKKQQSQPKPQRKEERQSTPQAPYPIMMRHDAPVS